MELIPPRSSVSAVRDSVLRYIKQSGVMPGERIPTERKLQEILGVSRSRIRDALASLESEGTVRRLIGDGTYLQKVEGLGQPDTHALTDRSSIDISLGELSPSQLIEARLAFEVSLSSLVVRNATNHDFERLEQVLDMSEKAQTEEEFEKLDTEFHHLIAVASHNELLIQFSHVIAEGRLAAGWRRLKKQSSTPKRRSGYENDHRHILKALQDRNGDEASALIREHLLAIHRALLGM